MDFWIRRTPENAENVVQVLTEFGFGSLGLTTSDFMEEGVMIQLGKSPSRLDILNFLTALDFDTAWRRRRAGSLDGIPVFFLGKEDLLDVQQIEDLDRDEP